MKINFKLLLVILEIALIPLFLLGFVAFSNAQKEITREIITKLEAIADIQKSRFLNRVSENNERLNLLTSRLQLRIETSAYVLNPNTASQDKIKSILIDAQKSIKDFLAIAVYSPNGALITSTNPVFVKNNISNEIYFQKGKVKNSVSTFVKNQQGIVNLFLAGPLIIDNKIVGVLIIVSNGSNITSVVNNYTGLGETGETLLVTKDAMGNALFLTPTRFNPKAALTLIIPKENTNVAVTHALNEEEGIFINVLDYRDTPVFAVTRYIKEFDWGIVAKINREEALLPINKLQNLLLFIGFISALVIIGTAISLSQSLTSPIKKLTNAAKKISLGDFSQKVNITTKDELGILANVFNEMTKKLEESYGGLEERVKAKTLELITKVQELENTKKASLNILEDLNDEKSKLAGEKAKDEALLNSIGDGLIATDEYSKIAKVNKRAETILGKTADEMLNKWIGDVLPAVDEKGKPLDSEKHPVAEALLLGSPLATALMYKRKDQSTFVIGVTVAPIIFAEKPKGAIVVFRDVTKEKEVDRMKTEFISLASHQLRTPLSAMKWFLEMLRNGDAGKLTSEQEEFVKNVDESNERMIALVNSLLNVSRIESGRIIVEPQPTDLAELLSGVQKEVELKLREKGQTLVISVHQDLPKVNLDPKLIRQVYMNLLTNSIKYTPIGGEISVFVSKTDTDILSQVSDNGYGIPAKDHAKVFQKFYRGENIIKLETDGNGLGMYLVKAIIDSSHGKIWFKSEEGKGTIFWFTLPLSGMKPKQGEVTLDS